ncbi:MAG: CCA tRNA nucleotidyltransferase [Candidatus Aenigmatarchaeota archaeon]
MVKLAKGKIEKTLAAALKKIKPGKKEEREMGEFTRRIIAVSKKHAKPMLCGSVVKGTWLAGRNEIDLFLLFSPHLKRKQLQKKGLDAAKKIIKDLKGKYRIAYAEHPYLRGKVKFKRKTFDVDIVPCYNIKNPAKIKSAVDRTPHHVRFVNRNIGKKTDDVRLLKQFCKAAGCYGADVKTQGFSGYLCELLIIKHKSFLNLLKQASKWHAGVAIDLKRKPDRQKLVEKFRSPLIVIDPVDPNRNVAAAVSPESFYKFVLACNEFLKHPHSKKFIVEKGRPYSTNEIFREIKKRGSRFYLIHFKRPDVLDDVLWPQMRRTLVRLTGLLAEGGFRVMRSQAFADNKECLLVLELDVWKVPRTVKHMGPTIFSAKQSNAFLKHYKDKKVFVEGNNWFVETQRKHTAALLFLNDFFSQKSKDLKAKGIPSKLAPEIASAKIASGADAIKMISTLPPDFMIFFRNYFEKNLNFLS